MYKYINKKYVFLTILFIAVVIFLGNANILKRNNEPKTVEKEEKTMYVLINGKNYIVELEDNNTVDELLSILPKKYDMSDLNNNEKYAYIEKKLNVNPTYIDEIKKGDIMIYGDNCLVIFYETFKTNYRYTKIGHINNLPDLGSENIEIEFKKGDNL